MQEREFGFEIESYSSLALPRLLPLRQCVFSYHGDDTIKCETLTTRRQNYVSTAFEKK